MGESIIGYADPLVVSPGDDLSIFVSCSTKSYTSKLVRLGPGIHHADGPPVNHALVPEVETETHLGREQYSRPGSYLIVKDWRAIERRSEGLHKIVVSFWCRAAMPQGANHDQYLFSTLTEELNDGIAFRIDRSGSLIVTVADFEGPQDLVIDAKLDRWQWYQIKLVVQEAKVEMKILQKGDITTAENIVAKSVNLQRKIKCSLGSQVVIGSHLDIRSSHDLIQSATFNGKIENFEIEAECIGILRTLIDFDFSRDMSSDLVRDKSGLVGILVNAPARAVTGHNWDARQVDWTKASDGYGAIAFHDDDVDDSSWDVDFKLSLPTKLRSGCYGILLDGGRGNTDTIPFFVRPTFNTPAPKTAIIMPTFTYTAYANEHLCDQSRPVHLPLDESSVHIDKNNRALRSRPDLGISLYDGHNDGSGTVYSSTKRPVLNMRPDYSHWSNDSPRELAADLWFIGFLERELGDNYDVLTDHDLSAQGAPLLCRYQVLLSASHPEYPNFAMLDAYSTFLSQGGSFMYLGGNGYYWITTHDSSPSRTHRIEVRRADQGVRSFELPAGEWHHSMTGERGGLWRSRGRPANMFVGLGTCACGMGKGAPYGISPEARKDPRLAFLLDGVEDDIIGDHGLVNGAASGDEIDRMDMALGTPPNTVLIASSKLAGGHSDDYGLFNEESMFPMINTLGSTSDKVRSDLIYFETAAQGVVFSVGSINWVGAMAWKNYNNPVARITSNVLHELLRRGCPGGR